MIDVNKKTPKSHNNLFYKDKLNWCDLCCISGKDDLSKAKPVNESMSMIDNLSDVAMLDRREQAADLPFETATARMLDPCDLAHTVIDGLFGLLFPDPHVRQRLGLKAVSRVPQETMTWYVWTNRRAGAISLSLLPDDPAAPFDGALLSLRYFPDPRESWFANFSPGERRIRLSPLFDHTGTPRTDVAEEIDPSLFHIGTLSIAAQDSNHLTLRLDAQDRWLESFDDGGQWHVQRDVPGLALSLCLLDALACGLSYLARRPPAVVRAWRRRGTAWRIGADGRAHSVADPTTTAWQIEHYGVPLPGRLSTAVLPPPNSLVEPPLFEHAGEIAPRYAPWPINPLWWQAAAWSFEPVGSFCAHCAAQAPDAAHCHEFPSRSEDDEHKT